MTVLMPADKKKSKWLLQPLMLIPRTGSKMAARLRLSRTNCCAINGGPRCIYEELLLIAGWDVSDVYPTLRRLRNKYSRLWDPLHYSGGLHICFKCVTSMNVTFLSVYKRKTIKTWTNKFFLVIIIIFCKDYFGRFIMISYETFSIWNYVLILILVMM